MKLLVLAPADLSPVLAAELLKYAPEAVVTLVSTPEGLAAAATEHTRIIACTTSIIVPAEILGRIGYGAYNLHPGTPDYPGVRPEYWARRERGPNGATLHAMAARVDSGPIVDVELCPLGKSHHEAATLAFGAAMRLFQRWARALTQPKPLPASGQQWTGRLRTRAEYEEAVRG